MKRGDFYLSVPVGHLRHQGRGQKTLPLPLYFSTQREQEKYEKQNERQKSNQAAMEPFLIRKGALQIHGSFVKTPPPLRATADSTKAGQVLNHLPGAYESAT